jgi:hypothetical protein
MNVRNISFVSTLTVFGLMCCCGCGSSNYPLAQVTGKVTKSGKPVSGASISFQPMASSGNANAGPGSFGITDAEGRYELKTFREKTTGAVIGRHRVTVQLPLPPGTPEDIEIDASLLSPMPFRNGSMQIEVPLDGLGSADFELDGK